MRYWIYWNDLVQGPFEVAELLSLHAFTADLPVCEEDRQEWTPAGSVSELRAHFEPAIAPVSGPVTPPPPPPAHPPTIIPLQGEFFGEPAAQEQLFDLNGRQHYSFRPVQDPASAPAEPAPLSNTNPFYFRLIVPVPAQDLKPPVVEPVARRPATEPPPLPIPPTPEREIPEFEESGSGAVEPEEMVVADEIAIPPPLEPKPEPRIPPPLEGAPPAVELPRTIPPQIKRTPLRPRVAIPDFTPVQVPSRVSIPEPLEDQPRLWPWMAGLTGILLIGAGVYFYLSRPPIPAAQPVMPEPVPVAVTPVDVIEPPPPKPVVTTPVKKTAPVTKPVVKKEPPPPVEKPVVMPGLADLEETPPAPPAKEPAKEPVQEPAVDKWRGREQEAIDRVLKEKIYAGKRTIGENAKLMMDQQHEKELLHAADTGERLYLPDKIAWSALREEGARYRVYLNFMAWQANGERVLFKSAQFIVDLKANTVQPADDVTRQDFFNKAAMLRHQPSAKAEDIQTMLNGVDAVNKSKLRAVIMKSDKQKEEQKKTLAGLQAAEAKLQKQIVYFRTKYAETTLQNIAKAYGFGLVLKGK